MRREKFFFVALLSLLIIANTLPLRTWGVTTVITPGMNRSAIPPLLARLVRLSNGRTLAEEQSRWQIIDMAKVEGTHFQPGIGGFNTTCHGWNYKTTDADKIVEWDEVITKQDHDAYREFHQKSPREIEWTLCAKDCTFSCDEIDMLLMVRYVAVKAKH